MMELSIKNQHIKTLLWEEHSVLWGVYSHNAPQKAECSCFWDIKRFIHL